MSLGPFDRRKNQSRCLRCTRSHLRCSGGCPCSNCTRRGSDCTWAPISTAAIEVGRGFHSTTKGQELVKLAAGAVVLPKTPSLNDQTRYIASFFETFLQRNSFTGKPPCLDVQSQLHSCSVLQHTVLAVGALHDCTTGSQRRIQGTAHALRSYKDAIGSLKSQLAQATTENWPAILWCTFFLGIFELMLDHTGDGWIKHIYHGTSQILASRGPKAFRSGAGRRFLLEARTFEVARAIIFSERTFLATPPWLKLMDHLWTRNYAKEWSPKESLLSIMTMCSDLCIRATEFAYSFRDSLPTTEDTQRLQSLAEEGSHLRSSLLRWEHSAITWTTPSAEDEPMTIAWTFYAATSIYLSGAFDYNPIWEIQHIATPILPRPIIERHVTRILDLTEFACKHTNLTGLVFLFPLRVAGARASTTADRRRITELLVEIKRTFNAASAFIAELGEYWAGL